MLNKLESRRVALRVNSAKGFVELMTERHKGLSINKSIRPIIDIFGQLLFRFTIPRQRFTEV